MRNRLCLYIRSCLNRMALGSQSASAAQSLAFRSIDTIRGRRWRFKRGKKSYFADVRTYKVYRLDSYLDCGISGIPTEESTDVLILILGNANMMVFLRRTGHSLRWPGINISCSNSTDASLAALYPGQLLYKELAICPFVASFGSPML